VFEWQSGGANVRHLWSSEGGRLNRLACVLVDRTGLEPIICAAATRAISILSLAAGLALLDSVSSFLLQRPLFRVGERDSALLCFSAWPRDSADEGVHLQVAAATTKPTCTSSFQTTPLTRYYCRRLHLSFHSSYFTPLGQNSLAIIGAFWSEIICPISKGI
jgi:hypothetical protein